MSTPARKSRQSNKKKLQQWEEDLNKRELILANQNKVAIVYREQLMEREDDMKKKEIDLARRERILADKIQVSIVYAEQLKETEVVLEMKDRYLWNREIMLLTWQANLQRVWSKRINAEIDC